MSLLAIQQQGAVIAVRNQALAVQLGSRTVQQVRAEDLQEVHLYGAIELTAAARRLLVRRGVDVLFFSRAGTFEARLVGAESSQGERRLAQFRALSDPTLARSLARSFVAGKIRNQRTVLRAAQRHRQDHRLATALAAMRQTLRVVEDENPPDIDALRGHEGLAARTYFAALPAAIDPPEFTFAGRSRRPPRDPFNACLSFAYTLLLRRIESAVRSAGLDPHLGALHAPGRGKPSLALDLMEEFRPALVDRLVLRLVNRRQLAPHDFVDPGVLPEDIGAPPDEHADTPPDPRPAVYLGPQGRAILLREFHGDLRRLVSVEGLEARQTIAAILQRQAMQVAHVVEGRQHDYTPYLIR